MRVVAGVTIGRRGRISEAQKTEAFLLEIKKREKQHHADQYPRLEVILKMRGGLRSIATRPRTRTKNTDNFTM